MTKVFPGIAFICYLIASVYSLNWGNWVQVVCGVYVGIHIFIVCFGNHLLLSTTFPVKPSQKNK